MCIKYRLEDSGKKHNVINNSEGDYPVKMTGVHVITFRGTICGFVPLRVLKLQ